ncbi:hypothetical protein, partial [Gordonibacter sp. KGMB07426]
SRIALSAEGGELNHYLRFRASRERMHWSASLRCLSRLHDLAFKSVSPRRKVRDLRKLVA